MRRNPQGTVCFCVCLMAFAINGRVVAQTIAPESLSTEQPANSNNQTTSSPLPIENTPPVSPSVRRFHYELKIDLRGAYDDNINLAPTNKIEDYYFRIDPSLFLGFGDFEGRQDNFARFEYAPDFVFFLDHSNFDTVQHAFRFDGQEHFSRLTLSGSEDIQIAEGSDFNGVTSNGSIVNSVNLDVRGQPSVNTFNTQLNAAYDLGGKTSLSGGLQSSISDYSQFISSETFAGNVFVNYAYSPKISVGIGGSGGHQFVDAPSPDQTFEQANVRLSYNATGKLAFSGSDGVEFRQSDNSTSDYVSPVFELDLTYAPFDGTTFTLSGSRRTTNSANLAGQDFTATQLTASLRQRLLDRFAVSLTGGYTNQSYFQTISAASSTRDDNYYFIQPTIDVRVTRYFFAGIYYLHREDQSSLANFSFNENQAGLHASLNF